MLAFFLVLGATSARVAESNHPAVKIIALLQKLQVQVKEEGEVEAVEFSKFQYWCAETTKEKEAEIQAAESEIAQQKAQILALTEDIAQLDTELDALATGISTATSAKSTAANQRKKDNSVYLANKADIEGTISAISTALEGLEQAKPSLLQQDVVQQAMALVDVYAPQKSAAVSKAFLQSRADPKQSDEADKFENRKGTVKKVNFKGGAVIETLKDLRMQFEDDLAALNKAEASSAADHALADGAKEDEINAASASKRSKEEIRGAKGQDKATAAETLESAEGERNSAKAILDDTTSQCRTRSDEWDERSKRRSGEIEAMGEAVEVLEQVTGVRSPESKGVETTYSFVQIDDPRQKVVSLLRKAGNTKHTAILRKLADEISALRQTPGSGTFDQINNMIEKMIFRLRSEQKSDDDHMHWCNETLSTTNQMDEDKTSRKNKFEADIESLKAEINEQQNTISTLRQQIVSLDESIAEETASRQATHAENAATVKDAQLAQAAVGKAVQILTEFYKSTGAIAKDEWEAFVQLRAVRRVRSSAAPANLWDSSYGSTDGGGSTVVGLLENIATDFAGMEAQAKADETSQQDLYDQFLTQSKITKSEKQKDAEMRSARVDRLSAKLQGREADNAQNQKELDATKKYLNDLNSACVDGDSSYEDRKAARKQERTALEKAETILANAFDAK